MGRIVFTVAITAIFVFQLQAKRLKGKVVDENIESIEFANVVAFVNDSVVGGMVTDAEGRFSMIVDDKCNQIRVSFIGYESKVIIPQGEDLEKIVLRQASTTLKEVEVEAPLIRREADRIVVNVAANPLSANKDAKELLSTAPGVWATDDALSIYGQGGTSVYIDDRKVNMSGRQLMAYLGSIQSSMISSIEIVPRGVLSMMQTRQVA